MKAKYLDDRLHDLTEKYDDALDAAAKISNEMMTTLLQARIDTELHRDEDFDDSFRDYTAKLEIALRMAGAMTATAGKYVKNPR